MRAALQAMLLLLPMAASLDATAGLPLQHQAVMMVSATVLASCTHTSHSAALADAQSRAAHLPSTFTVSCTPGSGKLYTASLENSDKSTDNKGQITTAKALLGIADTDTSTRVFTISGIETLGSLAQRTQAGSIGGGFIKLRVNY